jgi:uncharacterized protein YukE
VASRIQVPPRSLTATASQLAGKAGEVTSLGHGLSTQLNEAAVAAAVQPLQGALDALCGAWSAAMGRVSSDLTTYAANTQLAADLFEANDQSVGQAMTPKVVPAQPTCQPNVFGQASCPQVA